MSIHTPNENDAVRNVSAHLSETDISTAIVESNSQQTTTLTNEDVAGFYAEHAEKPFFGGLAEYMTSGPVVLIALQGENAIKSARTLNGATNPANAEPGTSATSAFSSISWASCTSSSTPSILSITP